MITDEMPSLVNRDNRIALCYRACSILRYIPSFRTRSILTPQSTMNAMNTLTPLYTDRFGDLLLIKMKFIIESYRSRVIEKEREGTNLIFLAKNRFYICYAGRSKIQVKYN